MNVTVYFFASLREVIDTDAIRLQLAEATIAGVRAQLKERLDAAQWEAVAASGVRVAVNQEIVRDDVVLKDGDEVAFLPPVTGG